MNRESAKWAPFESLFKSKDLLKELEENSQLHDKPILSEDDFHELQTLLVQADHTKEKIKIIYYFQGREYEKIGMIDFIVQDKVYFTDHTSLYLDQILKIKDTSF